MTDQRKTEPTTPVPIFVGPGTEGDHAADFYLTLMEWAFRDEMNIQGNLDGELSAWIEEALGRPLEFERQTVRAQDKSAVQREVIKETAALLIDLRNIEEAKIADLLGSIPGQSLKQITEVLREGHPLAAKDASAAMIRDLGQKFGETVTCESLSALGNIVQRCRASRAAALCMAIHKEHPLVLINHARNGGRDAVLKLVKIDKLFVSDSCTSQVIRTAGLRNDHPFLGQLARAINYKVETNWRQGCRFYIYALSVWGIELPILTKLWQRIDPEGGHFSSADAFEKFVERSRKEFHQMQIAAKSS